MAGTEVRSKATELDAVVVGAGWAGLAAASSFDEAGLDYRVLEAGSAVGGRARSREIDGCPVHTGAGFVGPQHEHVHGLAKEYGLELESARLLWGPCVWQYSEGERVGYLPPLSVSEHFQIARLAMEWNRLAAGVPVEAPWEAPRADSMSARNSRHVWERSGRVRSAAKRVVLRTRSPRICREPGCATGPGDVPI